MAISQSPCLAVNLTDTIAECLPPLPMAIENPDFRLSIHSVQDTIAKCRTNFTVHTVTKDKILPTATEGSQGRDQPAQNEHTDSSKENVRKYDEDTDEETITTVKTQLKVALLREIAK